MLLSVSCSTARRTQHREEYLGATVEPSGSTPEIPGPVAEPRTSTAETARSTADTPLSTPAPGRRSDAAWPALALSDWEATYATLHRWLQIVGKTRLVLSPLQNHWWHAPLYVSARGLTTSPIPYEGREFEVEFDFIDHLLAVRTTEGQIRGIPLEPQSVADFYTRYMAMLTALEIDVPIRPVPTEIADVTPFPDDEVHVSYDADAAHRCWKTLAQTDRVLKEFRGRFLGKTSPVHFWWGAFDIACTRFSGRAAPRHPGGIPNLPDFVAVEGYSHECISAGWWPGSIGGPVAEPAFYAYSFPMPPGCDVATVKPEAAYFHQQLGEWILPYESIRSSPDPDAALLEFLQSTYDVAADLAGWDRSALERPADWTLPR